MSYYTDLDDALGQEEEAYQHYKEEKEERYQQNINAKKQRYSDNKLSEVGTTIRCANCGKRILKKHYQTQFCSNKGPGNCKDKYWNCATPERLSRAQFINR